MALSSDELKQAVAKAAVQELSPNMFLGVGTGSTVDCFIDALGESKLPIRAAVSSSLRSEHRLRDHGIKVLSLNDIEEPLDLYVDGADEIDGNGCMTKGGGAALTREKIVASASKAFLCIVDESKQVQTLGRFPLPIEVIEMAIQPVTRALTAMGGQPKIREGVITDNGHCILDVRGFLMDNPLEWEDQLNAIPGIVAHGVFARQKAAKVLVSTQQGLRTISFI
ncbi:MAG: ribose-5-phosphate isomerase RpiA [Bordetella sp.]